VSLCSPLIRFSDTTNYILIYRSALNGAKDPAFKEFFGTVSDSKYRKITGRFYNLQGAKQYANTQEQQSQKFEFSCIDRLNHCVNSGGDEVIGAYVPTPARNTVVFCPLFFSSRVLPLSYLCSSPGYHPSNDAHYYRGAKAHLPLPSALSYPYMLIQELRCFMNSCM
jgi:hypothetical protein